jgi:hypothetical protein
MARPLRSLLLFALIAAAMPTTATGQERASTAIPLAQLIGAFLVDSGVRTAGLQWTTGNSTPIRWYSAAPVTNTDPAGRARGLTHTRTGAVRVTLGDSVTLPMHVLAIGPATGLAQVVFSFDSLQVDSPGGGGFFVHREMVETALRNDGMILQPIKCQRATEGASYGNLVDAAKLPGKTASGLWWYWQSVQQELQITLSLLYRRADMAQVECYGG